MLWAIQRHPTSEASRVLAAACERLSVPYVLGGWQDGELPELPVDTATLFHGSCAFADLIGRAGHWSPGVCFSAVPGFDCASYRAHYGDALVNAGGEIVPLAEADTVLSGSQPVFLRSCGDLKELTGAVWKREQLRVYLDKLRAAGDAARLNLPVLVAPRQRLDREWRLFVVDRRVVAGSQYRYYGDLCCEPGVPAEVSTFAETLCRRWTPAPVFVMDVAQISDRLGLIELNGFHSSGFYACDVATVIQAVEAWCAKAG